MTNFDFNWIGAAIDDLTTTHQAVFLSEGWFLLHSLAIIVLVTYALKWALESVSHWHGVFNLPGLVQFFVMYLIAESMLRYYMTPLPWVNVSLSGILPDTMHTYANWIDNSRLDVTLTQIGALLSHMERPRLVNFIMVIPYVFVELDMWILQGVLFAVTATGFVCLAIGRLLGPLFIPFFIVPRLSFLFWNWLQYILQYSLYRVVAAALVYVCSTFITSFFTAAVGTDYSLAHMLELLPAMFVIVVAACWMIFKVTSIVADMSKGAAAAGGGFIGGVAAAMRGAFV